MPWLLDSNAVSVLLNERSPIMKSKVAAYYGSQLVLCSVVKAELLYGAWRCADTVKALHKLERIFRELESFPFDDRAAEEYGRLHAHLSVNGTRIGPNDTMIAAIALANNLTLVTHNTREFSRVPNLKIEDWQD